MRRFGIIAILGILLTACSSEPQSQGYTPPVIPVLMAEVTVQDVPVYIESLGSVKPSLSVEVRPQVSGRLMKVHFTEGQTVKKGTLLFSIEPDTYRNKLIEAKAQYDQDRASLEATRKKSERYASLTQKDLVSQQDWDDMQALLIKSESILEADEAKFASAEADFKNCTITAPIDGRTGKISTHPGNIVTASMASPLVTIANVDPLYVEFTLTEKEYQQIAPAQSKGGLAIEITPLASQTQVQATRTPGAMTFLDHTFDAKTGLLLVRGQFANAEGTYLPGQSVKVYLPVNVIKDAKVVPQHAVKINQQGPYVFVVQPDNTAMIRQISTGDEIGDKVIVLEGLETGETVITDGHLRLAPGMKVEIKKEQITP